MHRRFICLKCNSVIVKKQTVASLSYRDWYIRPSNIDYLSILYFLQGHVKKHVNFYYRLVRIYFYIKYSVRRIKLKIRKTESSRCWKTFFTIFHKILESLQGHENFYYKLLRIYLNEKYLFWRIELELRVVEMLE